MVSLFSVETQLSSRVICLIRLGDLTPGAKRRVGAKRPGGNVLGAKRLGEEMV